MALAVAAGWSGAAVAQAGTRALKRVAAARHGGAVVVTWSGVARAQTYTVSGGRGAELALRVRRPLDEQTLRGTVR